MQKDKAIVSRRVLDQMIRAAMANASECEGIEPMPVVWRPRNGNGNGKGNGNGNGNGHASNWRMPGWIGDAHGVRLCQQRLESYLQLLASRFDIPDEDE